MPVRNLLPRPADDTPFDAKAVDGEVVVMGARSSEALTPEAALESAARIKAAAEQALQERSSSPG